MKNSEKKFKYIDLRDAADNLALSQHHLVRELLKLGSMIWIRFDDISSRMVKIVPPRSHQKFIDYRINPGDIHCLTLDSSKRIERMLEKSELVFEGLRLEIDFPQHFSKRNTQGFKPRFIRISKEPLWPCLIGQE